MTYSFFMVIMSQKNLNVFLNLCPNIYTYFTQRSHRIMGQIINYNNYLTYDLDKLLLWNILLVKVCYLKVCHTCANRNI